MKQRSLAGWIFAGPSLLVIGVFFGLPVLSALALSMWWQPRAMRAMSPACRCSGSANAGAWTYTSPWVTTCKPMLLWQGNCSALLLSRWRRLSTRRRKPVWRRMSVSKSMVYKRVVVCWTIRHEICTYVYYKYGFCAR